MNKEQIVVELKASLLDVEEHFQKSIENDSIYDRGAYCLGRLEAQITSLINKLEHDIYIDARRVNSTPHGVNPYME